MAMASVIPTTPTGTKEPSSDPSPDRPSPLKPQQEMAPPSRSAQESPTPAATAVAGLSGVAASAKTGDLSVLDLSELLEQLAASRAISVNRQKAKKLRGDSRFMGIQPITAVGCLRITAHLLVNNFNRRATVHLFC